MRTEIYAHDHACNPSASGKVKGRQFPKTFNMGTVGNLVLLFVSGGIGLFASLSQIYVSNLNSNNYLNPDKIMIYMCRW